jgi:hypothetical protein
MEYFCSFLFADFGMLIDVQSAISIQQSTLSYHPAPLAFCVSFDSSRRVEHRREHVLHAALKVGRADRDAAQVFRFAVPPDVVVEGQVAGLAVQVHLELTERSALAAI